MPYRVELERRALIVMISALFLFLQSEAHAEAGLAQALYDEGDWRGARTEAQRAQLADPEDSVARMIHALAVLRLDSKHAPAAEEAYRLVEESEDGQVRARTAYEFGRIRWESGDPASAYDLLRKAFGYSKDYELFLKTAYSLDILLARHPEFAQKGDPAHAQIRTVRPLITRAVRQDAEPPSRARASWLAAPARGTVRFYQSQIGPAIGQRCSMHPSCSAYCMEATRTYGLVGIPMTADRLVRETDHVNYRINPVIRNGQEKYYDPVSDHTGWFRRYRR